MSFAILYIGMILIDPGMAPAFIPEMNTSYEVDGWIFFSRDKLGHFFLIGMAAFFLNFVLQAKTIHLRGFSIYLGSLIIALLVTVEEFRQVPLTDRSFEMFDIFYNFAGIFILGRVGAWLVKKMELSIKA